jgi:hypothetical protein
MMVRAGYEVERVRRSYAVRDAMGSPDKRDHLAYAMEQVTVDGLWLEFGVGTGGAGRAPCYRRSRGASWSAG